MTGPDGIISVLESNLDKAHGKCTAYHPSGEIFNKLLDDDKEIARAKVTEINPVDTNRIKIIVNPGFASKTLRQSKVRNIWFLSPLVHSKRENLVLLERT